MKTIIYRKSDLQCVGTVVNNMTIEQEIKLNVIPNFGGTVDDYASIQTDKVNIHLENVNGIVTVIENTLPLNVTKQQKINEMNATCQSAILNTFESNAFDGKAMQSYSCELTDQSRINGLVTIAQLRLANLTTEPINYYQNKDAIKCIEWQPQNMLNLGLDLKRHIEKNTDHYEDLKVYINSLTTVEEVQKVTWDTVIPTA